MPRIAGPRPWVGLCTGLCAIGLVTGAVAWAGRDAHSTKPRGTGTPVDVVATGRSHGSPRDPVGPQGTVTLAFAGDMHFQLQLAALLDQPRGALGPITRTLAAADLTMVNLESTIAEGGAPDPKELEVPSDRYWFRTSPRALDVLDAAGVDVVTMANNHGADYGSPSLAETLRARRHGPIAVLGVGMNRQDAFAPYEVSIRGTDIAFLAADASMREGSSGVWAAGATTPGIAAARADRPHDLMTAVSVASKQADVVVVYMHWGEALHTCPTRQQTAIASALARSGADVVVGSHAHVLLGSGWLGDTYVDYGLGNFLWYHNHEPETGILRLTISDGHVVDDSWIPARIRTHGRPLPLRGADRADAITDWRRLRSCTGLASSSHEALLPVYSWSARRIGPRLQERMRSSHRPGCPISWSELRYLRMTYVGFDGRAHNGEMAVHKDFAPQVASVFERLYEARWPIRRMRLVDDFRGNDNRSMAANNTSGYNCRRVAGSPSWSAHAYGAAVDINPVLNPDLSGPSVAPRAGRRYAAIDRTADTRRTPGVITANSLVVRAFVRIGWAWGGTWPSGQDYQHFSAPISRALDVPAAGAAPR